MLNMKPTNNKKLLDSLSFAVFSKAFDGEIGYVFYKDDAPVGFTKLEIGDTSKIVGVAILPDCRKKGYGDFFTRSTLFRLTQISRYIEIGYVSDYFLKFGFNKKGQIMEIESDKLVFIDKNHHC